VYSPLIWSKEKASKKRSDWEIKKVRFGSKSD
jgi:hypothetical protein